MFRRMAVGDGSHSHSSLAAPVAGSIAVETVTVDVLADPSALLQTGFHFTYPSYHKGVSATLTRMGYTPQVALADPLA
jgi:hypothetical protein